MDEDAMFAIGCAIAALGGMLERKGICTVEEVAETLGGVSVITGEAGPRYRRRAALLGSWALMVDAAAEGAQGERNAEPRH
jgi:hypothetical protein